MSDVVAMNGRWKFALLSTFLMLLGTIAVGVLFSRREQNSPTQTDTFSFEEWRKELEPALKNPLFKEVRLLYRKRNGIDEIVVTGDVFVSSEIEREDVCRIIPGLLTWTRSKPNLVINLDYVLQRTENADGRLLTESAAK